MCIYTFIYTYIYTCTCMRMCTHALPAPRPRTTAGGRAADPPGTQGEPRLKIMTARAGGRLCAREARGPRRPLINIIKTESRRASKSSAWYYLIRMRPRGLPRGRPREASGSRSHIAHVVSFDTNEVSRPASRLASKGLGIAVAHRPRGII